MNASTAHSHSHSTHRAGAKCGHAAEEHGNIRVALRPIDDGVEHKFAHPRQKLFCRTSEHKLYF